MHPWAAFLRCCAVVLLFGILGGCNTARLAYDNGETVSYFLLNRWVDFDADQKPWVKKEIAAFFAWHRQTQLGDYAAWLGAAQKQMENPVTEADVDAAWEAARERLRTAMDRAAPALADLALSLREQQIAHIASRFDDANEDFRKERMQGEFAQRQEARYRRTLKAAERWFGSFSADQRRGIRMLSEARPLDDEMELAERVARQQALLALLRTIHAEKPSRDAAVAMVRTHLAQLLEPSADVGRRAYFERRHAATVHMIANIINNATLQQRQHCIDELQGWIDDFERHSPAARTGPLKPALFPRLD
jgi:hypothetical protein